MIIVLLGWLGDDGVCVCCARLCYMFVFGASPCGINSNFICLIHARMYSLQYTLHICSRIMCGVCEVAAAAAAAGAAAAAAVAAPMRMHMCVIQM